MCTYWILGVSELGVDTTLAYCDDDYWTLGVSTLDVNTRLAE